MKTEKSLLDQLFTIWCTCVTALNHLDGSVEKIKDGSIIMRHERGGISLSKVNLENLNRKALSLTFEKKTDKDQNDYDSLRETFQKKFVGFFKYNKTLNNCYVIIPSTNENDETLFPYDIRKGWYSANAESIKEIMEKKEKDLEIFLIEQI